MILTVSDDLGTLFQSQDEFYDYLWVISTQGKHVTIPRVEFDTNVDS